jgi:threonine/homoserine/homoserine lactone efflux protein
MTSTNISARPAAAVGERSRPARPAVRRRNSRAGAVVAAAGAASVIYLVASGAGVPFELTDPGKTQPMHLALVTIAGVAGFFALAGWAALALLERYSRRASRIWSILAGTVLLLSCVPIGVEHATPATKITLALIHTTVAATLVPMLRRARTQQLTRSAGR